MNPLELVKTNSNRMSETALRVEAQQDTFEEKFPSLSILGICGSIGTGKSYASSLLASKVNDISGKLAYHIDTDSLAHGVYAPGSKAIGEIEKEFGSSVIVDGTVDRKSLGAIVFGEDKSKMEVSRFEGFERNYGRRCKMNLVGITNTFPKYNYTTTSHLRGSCGLM